VCTDGQREGGRVCTTKQYGLDFVSDLLIWKLICALLLLSRQKERNKRLPAAAAAAGVVAAVCCCTRPMLLLLLLLCSRFSEYVVDEAV
jgi:predicted branched-subunit amino acid permease